MSKLRAVMFDLYGTLVDIRTNENRDETFESLSHFLEYRRVFVSGKELKELYFSEINQQIARSREKYPEIDVARAFRQVLQKRAQTTDRYLAMITTQLYRSLCREKMLLFEDTFWTLNEFRKHYHLGIVSDAQRLYCNPEMRSLRIEDFFDAIVISSNYGFRKPDPRLFHIVLAMLDIPASAAAYIGNNYHTDVVGAKAAGLAVAGLIRQPEKDIQGYSDELAPDFVSNDLHDAFKWISENTKI